LLGANSQHRLASRIAPFAFAFGADGFDSEFVGFGALEVGDGGAAAGGELGLLPSGGGFLQAAFDDVGAGAFDAVPGEVNLAEVIAEGGLEVGGAEDVDRVAVFVAKLEPGAEDFGGIAVAGDLDVIAALGQSGGESFADLVFERNGGDVVGIGHVDGIDLTGEAGEVLIELHDAWQRGGIVDVIDQLLSMGLGKLLEFAVGFGTEVEFDFGHGEMVLCRNLAA
jgi:hypothetical protein